MYVCMYVYIHIYIYIYIYIYRPLFSFLRSAEHMVWSYCPNRCVFLVYLDAGRCETKALATKVDAAVTDGKRNLCPSWTAVQPNIDIWGFKVRKEGRMELLHHIAMMRVRICTI